MSYFSKRTLAITGVTLAVCFAVGSLTGQYSAAITGSPALKNQQPVDLEQQHDSWWKWFLQVTHVEDPVPQETVPPVWNENVNVGDPVQENGIPDPLPQPALVPDEPTDVVVCPPEYHCSDGGDCPADAMAILPPEGAMQCQTDSGQIGSCWRCWSEAVPDQIVVPPEQSSFPGESPPADVTDVPTENLPDQQPESTQDAVASSSSGIAEDGEVPAADTALPTPVTPESQQPVAQPPSDDCGPVPSKGVYCPEAKFWCGPAGHWYEVCLYPSA